MLISEGAQALTSLEDDSPDAIFAALPGTDILIWPQLRMPLAQAIEETDLNAVAAQTAPPSTFATVRRMATELLPNRFSSDSITRDRDLLFMTRGGTYAQTPTGRRNWLVHDFAEEFSGRSVILQDATINRSRTSPTHPLYRPTFTFAPALVRVEIATRLQPLSPDDSAAALVVIDELLDRLPYPIAASRRQALVDRVLYTLGRVRHVDAQFARVLDRVRPRIAFVEDASYGAQASLIGALKDRGTTVVEPQHGWIGPSHGSYNFGAAMSEEPLRRGMPDVLMTFGDYWTDSVRHPARVVSVGKPRLESMVASEEPVGSRAKEVLVVSSVYDTPRLIQVVRELLDALPADWRVLLRPHPSERPIAAEVYSEVTEDARVELDRSADLYDSLARVRGVFGFASTALYEALAFDIYVFVIDSPIADLYVPVSVFGERVGDLASLRRAAVRLQRGKGDPSADDARVASIWKPAARQNFRTQVEGLLAERA